MKPGLCRALHGSTAEPLLAGGQGGWVDRGWLESLEGLAWWRWVGLDLCTWSVDCAVCLESSVFFPRFASWFFKSLPAACHGEGTCLVEKEIRR